MVEAGEKEDDIALVIRNYAPPASKSAPTRTDRFTTGVGEGLTDIRDVALPSWENFARAGGDPMQAAGRHALDIGKGLGSAVGAVAKSVPSVVRGIANGETRRETLTGLFKALGEGYSGVSVDEVKKDPWQAGGRFVGNTVIPGAATFGAAPLLKLGQRVVKGQRMAKAAKAAEHADMVKVANGMSSAGDVPDRVVAEGMSMTPGERQAVTARKVTGARIEPSKVVEPHSAPRPGLQMPVPAAKKAAPAPKATESPVSASPKGEAGVGREGDGGSAPKPAGVTKLIGGQQVTIRPKAGTVSDLRGAVGSQRAASTLGISPDDVKRMAPGPSRRPLAAEVADLDQDFMRQVANERGAINPKLALPMGLGLGGAALGAATAQEGEGLEGALMGGLAGASLANPKKAVSTAYHGVIKPARMIGMLTGMAVPKGVLGVAGAHLNAAIDNGTMAPIKQFAKPMPFLRDMKQGWKDQANPSDMAGVADGSFLSKFNYGGRASGALDFAGEKSLMRAGLNKTQAQKQLLTAPNEAAAKLKLTGEFGKYAVPFQRIPFNQVAEGAESIEDVLQGAGTKLQRGATVGAGILGGAAATQTDDPISLGLMAALTGRRGAAFTLGAAGQILADQGHSRALSVSNRMGTGIPGISFADAWYPHRPIMKPAAVNALNWVSPGAGDVVDFSKAGEPPKRPERPKRPKRPERPKRPKRD